MNRLQAAFSTIGGRLDINDRPAKLAKLEEKQEKSDIKIQKCREKLFLLIEKAIDGDTKALVKLEGATLDKKIRRTCLKDTFNRCLDFAKNGNLKAKYQVARMYEMGLGTIQDTNHANMNYQFAAALLKDEAEKGDAEAQYLMANMLRDGNTTITSSSSSYEFTHGVSISIHEAYRYYGLALEQGYVKAGLGREILLKKHLSTNPKLCYSKLRKKLDEKLSDKQRGKTLFALARFYQEVSGISDTKEAFDLLLNAAETCNNAGAQYFLGNIYRNRTDQMSKVHSMSYYRRAAKQGHYTARVMYEQMKKSINSIGDEAKSETVETVI